MDAATLPIDDVLARAKEGESAAFGLIYERYSRPIHNYIMRIMRNQAEADDITQETFLRAFQNLSRLRDETRVESWLYSIASHLCFDLLRRRKVVCWQPLEPKHEDHADRTDLLTTFAEGQVVQEALSRLPAKYAACLVLRSVDGFSCEEIAEILKISKGAVWTRLSRAREMFCDAYEELNRSAIK